jgi:hypothetical protein
MSCAHDDAADALDELMEAEFGDEKTIQPFHIAVLAGDEAVEAEGGVVDDVVLFDNRSIHKITPCRTAFSASPLAFCSPSTISQS